MTPKQEKAKRALQAIQNTRTDSLLSAVDNFRTFLPHGSQERSVHDGEEGRFVELLVAEYLVRHLPERAAVASGFVVDLGTGSRSGQIDILVYDGIEHNPYLKYGDAVIVARESVLAAISIKKKLKYDHVKKEIRRLSFVGDMCGGQGKARPYLCLFALDVDSEAKVEAVVGTVFEHVQAAYPERAGKYSANQLVDSVIVLNPGFRSVGT